ncbi:hypothetical protein T03_1540 [Trichinella britovi]|uniref:Uncharacterized protein n=1 Tax=Trichinella britovi TaxID=45882 RepID=A0A0V1CDD1_TRIBR|nr:hypothetical protein T03_1540 [Trichinella britovi]
MHHFNHCMEQILKSALHCNAQRSIAHPEAAGLDRRVWAVLHFNFSTRHLKYTIYHATIRKIQMQTHIHTERRKQSNQPQTPPLHVTAFIATDCPDIQVPTDVDLAYQTRSRANTPDINMSEKVEKTTLAEKTQPGERSKSCLSLLTGLEPVQFSFSIIQFSPSKRLQQHKESII